MTLSSSVSATRFNPNFYDGPAEVCGDIRLRQRFFSYKLDRGWVGGKTFNAEFTIDCVVKQVWPYFKDFNLWQNSYGHYYSGVIGDMEGEACRLSSIPNEPGPKQYSVLRVIPEHLIVLFQTIPEFGPQSVISPDCHVFMLTEHDGRTVVTALMEHAALFEDADEEGALRPWRDFAPESHRKFRDIFIPALRKLACDAK